MEPEFPRLDPWQLASSWCLGFNPQSEQETWYPFPGVVGGARGVRWRVGWVVLEAGTLAV